MEKITHLSRLKIRWLNTKTLILLLFSLFLPFLQLQAQAPCTIMAANFTEDFENAVPYTDAPDCWTAINTTSWSYAEVVIIWDNLVPIVMQFIGIQIRGI